MHAYMLACVGMCVCIRTCVCCYVHAYLQLALLSFDSLSGAEALPSLDLAYTGMAITLTGWGKETERQTERETDRETKRVRETEGDRETREGGGGEVR